jgi:cytochrome P450
MSTTTPEGPDTFGSGTEPPPHPFDQDGDGVNRPGLFKNAKYHAIRETGTGVAEVLRPGGVRAKLVTRYDDIVRVFRDQEVFSREAALDVDHVDLEGTILGLDRDAHAEVRNVVKEWFTPQAITNRQGEIHDQALSWLRSMVEAGEPADLVDAFAIPFSLHAICDMLDLPEADRLQFRGWGDAFLGTTTKSRAEAGEAQQAMAHYLFGLLRQRGEAPGPDLLSHIAVHGAHLPPDRLVKLPMALVVGGWETSANAIGTCVEYLLTHPYGEHETAYRHLVANRHEIPGAVTELERVFSVSAQDDVPRRVLTAVTLPSGARLDPGDVVIPSHDAANHDPRVFADPLRIDFSRSPNRHLSFGHGPHHCIGRHLGHLEAVLAVQLLTGELPGLRLAVPADEVPHNAGHSVSGPARLPVAWS